MIDQVQELCSQLKRNSQRYVKSKILENFKRGHSAIVRVPERTEKSSLWNYAPPHSLKKFLPCWIKIKMILIGYCLLNQH